MRKREIRNPESEMKRPYGAVLGGGGAGLASLRRTNRIVCLHDYARQTGVTVGLSAFSFSDFQLLPGNGGAA